MWLLCKYKRFKFEKIRQFSSSISNDGSSTIMEKKCSNFEYQLNMFTQFCKAVDWGYSRYKCQYLYLKHFGKQDIRSKYFTLWNDFVSIQFGLVDGKLRHLFENILNVNRNKTNQFFDYFRYCRKFCIILPVNCAANIGYNVPKFISDNKPNAWFTMTQIFNTQNDDSSTNNIGNLNHFYRFMLIWNGVFSVLRKNFELTDKIKSIMLAENNDDEKEKDKENENEKKNTSKKNIDNMVGGVSGSNVDHVGNEEDELTSKLTSLISEYICDQFTQTNIFGHCTSVYGSSKKEREKILSNNEVAYNLCKKLLFNDSFDEINKLIAYCINQNISNIKNYQMYPEAIVPFIVNHVAYVIFYDLTIDALSNNNNNNNYKLLYPQLLKIFKFFYNLSCYIYCYPFEKRKESFYISQYFDLKSTLFGNIFDNKEICQKAAKLCNYNYFGYRNIDGTLLHVATAYDYRSYCKILLTDGFDINEKNRLLKGGGYDGSESIGYHVETPFQIAEALKRENVLSMMTPYINNNERDDLN